MRSFNLDREITVQSATIEANEYGQDIETWSDYKTLWANVEVESTRDRIRSNRIEAAAAYVIRIRYRDDITSDMRILFEGKTLNINGPPKEILGRKVYLEILATLKD